MTGLHSCYSTESHYLIRYVLPFQYWPVPVVSVLLLASITFLSVARGAEATPNLVFVVNADTGIYREVQRKILHSVRAELGPKVAGSVLNLARLKRAQAARAAMPTLAGAGPTLIVTIGTDAAQYAYQHFKKHKILNTLITYDSFQHNVRELYGSEQAALSAGVSALLLEQPIRRYFELGATLVPNAQEVGVLLGPSSLRYASEIQSVSEAYGVNLKLVELSETDNPIHGIQPVLSQADYFIVLPDQQAFNRSVAQWVLQLSYRHHVPVIGYSKRYAEAGAIASVYSSADDIAQQASRWLLLQIHDSSTASTVQVAEQFSVQLNPSVAKAIGIILPDEAENRVGADAQNYKEPTQ